MSSNIHGTFQKVTSIIKDLQNTVDLYYEQDLQLSPHTTQSGKVVCYIHFEQSRQKHQQLKISTDSGESIVFELINLKSIDMGNGTTIISGYSYDNVS